MSTSPSDERDPGPDRDAVPAGRAATATRRPRLVTADRDCRGSSFDARRRGGRGPGRESGFLVVDAANVVGSRPTGWWRDRPGAARKLVEDLRAAAEGERATVVTADRELASRARTAGATVVGPRWLLERLAEGKGDGEPAGT